MSTDPSAPRTRAEARALRAAAEAAEPEAPQPAEPEPSEPAEPEPSEPAEPERSAPAGPVEARGRADDFPNDSVRQAQGAAPAEPVEARLKPQHRRFGILLLAILGVLAVVSVGLGAVSLFQGPRLSAVQVDEAQAIDVSGSRLILTTNQALDPIEPEQVSVEPAVPFTIDAAGRSIGIRFTVPLDDSAEYTVRVADVVGTGGGPSADLTTTFTTPASQIFLLTRDAEGEDKIFRTDLTGENAVPVFTADRIDDFRATSTQLVVAVEREDGSAVMVMDRDGSDQRELTLPGDGFVTSVQVSDRGGLVGYSYSDRELSETSGRASVLVTQRLDGTGEPRIVEVAGEEASIDQWQFVPDSAAILFIDFDGALSLEDRSGDAGVQSLGLAMTIQGVSRGTYTAIIERTDGSVVELNLADGSEAPLAASSPDYGVATTITPYPGGTLRHVVARDDNGLPIGQAVVRVDDDGTATPIVEVDGTDTILQTCASPSGQYAAVVVAPDLANNEYDDMLAPLPKTMHTHIIDMASGEEIVPLTGFDISWCQAAPKF